MPEKKDVRKNEAPYEPTYAERKNEAIAREYAKLTPNLVELALHANEIASLIFHYENE